MLLQYNITCGRATPLLPSQALLPSNRGAAMVADLQSARMSLPDEPAMTEPKPQAICVGEVLIELARGGDGRFALSCGGDTFNTAVYLARAGASVAFASAIGDDPYSDSIVALAAAEGIAVTSHPAGLRPAAGAVPHRKRSGRRAQLPLLARRRPGARTVRAAGLDAGRRRHLGGESSSISPA